MTTDKLVREALREYDRDSDTINWRCKAEAGAALAGVVRAALTALDSGRPMKCGHRKPDGSYCGYLSEKRGLCYKHLPKPASPGCGSCDDGQVLDDGWWKPCPKCAPKPGEEA